MKHKTIEGTIIEVIGHAEDRDIKHFGGATGLEVKNIIQKSILEIKIESNSPVESLIFTSNSWPPIEKGDYIRAVITMTYLDNLDKDKKLIRKELTPVEKADTIEKIKNGEVVATYNNY
ncbi:MAG: hypothetical protein JSW73_05415 [Candidatus Woesearchaeota archaeon]|nr:MAG: hypothetical protein JSW73_05415 [Candidatus Woesearchaeota archaeon]